MVPYLTREARLPNRFKEEILNSICDGLGTAHAVMFNVMHKTRKKYWNCSRSLALARQQCVAFL